MWKGAKHTSPTIQGPSDCNTCQQNSYKKDEKHECHVISQRKASDKIGSGVLGLGNEQRLCGSFPLWHIFFSLPHENCLDITRKAQIERMNKNLTAANNLKYNLEDWSASQRKKEPNCLAKAIGAAQQEDLGPDLYRVMEFLQQLGVYHRDD